MAADLKDEVANIGVLSANGQHNEVLRFYEGSFKNRSFERTDPLSSAKLLCHVAGAYAALLEPKLALQTYATAQDLVADPQNFIAASWRCHLLYGEINVRWRSLRAEDHLPIATLLAKLEAGIVTAEALVSRESQRELAAGLRRRWIVLQKNLQVFPPDGRAAPVNAYDILLDASELSLDDQPKLQQVLQRVRQLQRQHAGPHYPFSSQTVKSWEQRVQDAKAAGARHPQDFVQFTIAAKRMAPPLTDVTEESMPTYQKVESRIEHTWYCLRAAHADAPGNTPTPAELDSMRSAFCLAADLLLDNSQLSDFPDPEAPGVRPIDRLAEQLEVTQVRQAAGGHAFAAHTVQCC
jgi:hypothetical protein